VTKPIVEPIRTPRLLLRPIGPDDLETIRRWRNHPDTRRWFLDRRVITAEAQRAWYESYLRRDDEVLLLMVAQGDPPVAVGQLGLSQVHRPPGEAEFGRLLVAPPYRGRGYAAEAILAVATHAARHLGVFTLRSFVLPENRASLGVLARCGFRRAGSREGLVVMERHERPDR